MSFPQATPARPVPGAFLNTPAIVQRFQAQAQQDPVRRQLFAGHGHGHDEAQIQNAQGGFGDTGSGSGSGSGSGAAAGIRDREATTAATGLTTGLTTGLKTGLTTGSTTLAAAVAGDGGIVLDDRAGLASLSPLPPPRVENVPAVLKAARAVNAFLQLDESFPDLDSYCRQGASSDYELPSSDSAWAPFQKTSMYPIPNQVFDHYNTGQLQTLMGLFAELNHAWVVIDNSLFLWDYTNPDPELIGFEDQPHTIHAVALVPPKPGIFVSSITHILVVATSSELILLGVSVTDGSSSGTATTASRSGSGTGSGSGSGSGSGTKSVALYQTKMVLPLRGNDIRVISGSADGRIFFGGCSDTDINELYYQSEEKWFSNRCGRINHSNPGWSSVVTLQSVFAYREPEHLVDIVIDDSRKLVYTLSSTSTIRTYHMEAPGRLTKVIEKTKLHCLRDIAHMISHSRLLDEKVSIVSISPISKQEAVKLHLMALTDTGCRLFFSATNASSYLYASQGSLAPQSMQVQFIKFPPSSFARRSGGGGGQFGGGQFGNGSSSNGAGESVDLESTTLVASRQGARFAPGFFLDFVTRSADSSTDSLFIAGPETGRIKRTSPTVPTRYFENASWIDIGSRAEAVGLITKPFAAASQPVGFGNELAVQFDEPPSEFAVLTNTGVHVIRRRRLVDTFAAAIRDSPGDDALDLMCRRLIQLYGRVETVSTALAVACGHGSDSTRPGSVRAIDQATEDRARGLFVDFGGQPTIVETDGSALTTDSVKLSSRHDALVLYLSRLIRQLWKTAVIHPQLAANGTMKIESAVPPAKLTSVQENLERLRRFIDTNKGLIQGMAGPSELQRVVVSRQEEVALQAEHQALHSLQKLMESISEGISFVLMLFDERVSDIFARLDDAARQQFRELTYEKLFSQADGKELAKLLVKAVVNRNIESGSNVETVADALRRRCGSFCSPDDVITFKAQEQLKRASEQPLNTNQSRVLLNESLTLFKKVAGSLTLSNLQAAAGQYVELRYYAGAIQLCLNVARECDRGNAALMWINDGRPANDPRLALFRERRRAYDLIHEVLTHLDAASSAEPLAVDGRPTLMATKRDEAYDVVNGSDDEVFHFDLYEWYIEQGWTERILSIDSPHVVTFLQRLASTNFEHADLLCRFYTNRSRFFDAAEVQAELAASDFQIGIKQRIQLLSLAKANANVATVGVSRQQQQRLSHAVTNVLEIANIQDDLLGRIMADDRFDAERKMEIGEKLDGKVLTLSELFNDFADQAGYHDLCLVIYHTANYRNPTTISGTWGKLIKQTHEEVMAKRESAEEQPNHASASASSTSSSVPWPYEAVTSKIRTIAHHTSLDSFVFPIQDLLPQLYRYAVTYRQDASIGASPTWPVQLFLSLGISHAMIVRVLETVFDTQDYGFSGAARNRIVEGIVYVVGQWVAEVRRRGGASGKGTGALGGGAVGELLQRCEAALPAAGGSNHGGAELADVRRVLRTLRREVAGLAERLSTGSRFM